MTALPLFTIDGYQHNYEAVSYGPTWNGWATPIVTRATLEGVMDEEPGWNKVTFAEDGTATVVFSDYPDEPLEIAPNAEGNYDLGALGYTFDTVDSDTNAPGVRHSVYVNDRSGNDRWRARCNCGWVSPVYPFRSHAEQMKQWHLVTVNQNTH